MIWSTIDWPLFALYLAVVAVAAATGVLFKPGRWYANLIKPAWTPPNWMFPVMWTTLYILMALAAAIVAGAEGTTLALGLWTLQIVLNAVWSPVFFGLHHMRTGLAIICLLWLAVAATTYSFGQVVPEAGWLMLPYLGWVTIAAALNRALIVLNPGTKGWTLG